MDDRALLNAFSDCIDRLAAGQSVEDCLRAYPELTAQLAPLLEAGRLAVRAQADTAEVERAQARVRSRFERALRTPAARPALPLRRLASLAAAVMLVFGLLFSGAVVTAQSSLPGDPLYGLKRWSEEVRLAFSGNGEGLRADFARRRVDETRQLLDLGREAEVTFEGEITTVSGQEVAVAGLVLQLAVLRPDDCALQAGNRIQVRARTTTRGELVALEIHPVGPPEPPVPTPDTSAPTVTRTPSLTRTTTPSATVTATPSLTTTTPSPTPTFTRTPAGNSSGQNHPTPCAIAPPADWVAYHVQPDDRLSALVEGSGVPLADVMRVNCLEYPHQIVAGQVIYLPPGSIPVTTPGHAGEGNGGDGGPHHGGGSEAGDGGGSGGSTPR